MTTTRANLRRLAPKPSAPSAPSATFHRAIEVRLEPLEPMDEIEQFVRLVQQRPILFNVRLIHYRNILMRKKAWKEVADAIGWSPKQCMYKWKSLRYKYMSERKDRLYSGGGKMSMGKRHFLNYMAFLEQYVDSDETNPEPMSFDQENSAEGFCEIKTEPDDYDITKQEVVIVAEPSNPIAASMSCFFTDTAGTEINLSGQNLVGLMELEASSEEPNTSSKRQKLDVANIEVLTADAAENETNHSDQAEMCFMEPEPPSETSNTTSQRQNELAEEQPSNDDADTREARKTRLRRKKSKMIKIEELLEVELKREIDGIDSFFLSIAADVKKFDPKTQAKLKLDIHKMIYNAMYPNK